MQAGPLARASRCPGYCGAMQPSRPPHDRITLVLPPGRTRPVMGVQPADEDLRTQTLARQGCAPSPRHAPPVSLVEAEDLRRRTVLSHQLPRTWQRALDEGLPAGRRPTLDGVVATLIVRGGFTSG